MARAVVSVAPEDTLGEAAQKMVDEGVGSPSSSTTAA